MACFNLFSRTVNIGLMFLISVMMYKTITCYETYYVEDMCSAGTLPISVSENGSSSSGILKATRHTSYSLQMSCKIQIFSPPHYGIVVSLREIGFRTNLDGSCKDYLKVFGSQINEEESDPVFCQRMRNFDESRSFVSKDLSDKTDNVFELLYQTSAGLNDKSMTGHPGFTLIFTAYTPLNASKTCQGMDEFLCDNARCIWSGLLCDGHNNCGDLSDEKAYGSSSCGYVGGGSLTLIILGILIVTLGFVSALITVVCYQERRKRRRTMRLRRKTESLIPIIQVIESPRYADSHRRSYGKKRQKHEDDGYQYQTFERTDSSTSSCTSKTDKKCPTEMIVVAETHTPS